VPTLVEKIHPYVVFLPVEKKDKILSAIFGSKAGVDILRFSLRQGISKNIYQKDLVKSLNYSNKTIIENLKTLTALGVLNESMEKNEKDGASYGSKLTSLPTWAVGSLCCWRRSMKSPRAKKQRYCKAYSAPTLSKLSGLLRKSASTKRCLRRRLRKK
jgi:hypothetical protein